METTKKEAWAARMEAGAEAVLTALSKVGIGDDPAVLAGVLGGVVGRLAAVTDDLAAILAIITAWLRSSLAATC
ncbi:hypothetical protein [Roseomonas populi]|uniref:Uncharacterized protein n=1 Tax=Roseomonas populi TaxID=3121582 RepID=A0ABT1XDQ2_9PROT|nr:hypothetical protein [Roseomonas pecuniae]MCR0985262.1 hypothetical protein [Roseomonas pecuniae]